jgi:alginate O-acetyltransferase complex protein AlgI
MLVCNLGILCLFKYTGFINSSVLSLFSLEIGLPEFVLPIGISFYTFQAISYVLDVYRGDVRAERNLIYVGLYIAMFPQLVAGPIVRYKTIAEQLRERRATVDDFAYGIERFIFGLSKKVLIANTLAPIADEAFTNAAEGGGVNVLMAWLGITAYFFQIYFDFSGYSDMAIGLGRMFGFKYLENFNYPYISSSVTEFWRRWHMSLSGWFRDYLYIPLGGSRVSTLRLMLNLLIVWFLTGFWHGANFTFIVWGLIYFVFLAGEKLIGIRIGQHSIPDAVRRLPVPARIPLHIYTLIVVLLAWVFFRAGSVSEAASYIESMFSFLQAPDIRSTFLLSENGIFFAIAAVCATPFPYKGYKWLSNKWIAGDIFCKLLLLALFILCIASLVREVYNPFIYFQF